MVDMIFPDLGYYRARAKAEQKRLIEIYKTQSTTCECGFPFIPPPETILEGFGGGVRVYKEHECKCVNCGNTKVLVG